MDSDLATNGPSATYDWSVGSIVDERFQIESELKPGGMARIYRATDLRTGAPCAIKIAKSDGNPALAQLAFDREYAALENLRHENIVRLIDAGQFQGVKYMALEWLGQTLSRKIVGSSPPDWDAFYCDVGRPLLLALAYAHGRGLAHRDLKPDNLLFDARGTIRIIDFGIATALNSVNYGQTLRHAGSIPYTPPEADDGIHSYGRDAYSWAVIAVSCISGRLFADLGAFISALATCDQSTAPVQVLRKAASPDPKQRYRSGIELLVEADQFHAKTFGSKQVVVPLELSPKSLRMISSNWPGKDADEQHQLIAIDLSAGGAAQTIDLNNQQGIRIVGATLEAICRRIGADTPFLRVEEIAVLGADRAEQMRRNMPTIEAVSYLVCDFQTARTHMRDIASFETRVRVAESEYTREGDRRRRERWLDCWSAVIREAERTGLKRRTAYKYRSMRREGIHYVATCDGDIDEEFLPESLVIQNSGGPLLLFKVVDVYIDQLVLDLQGALHELVPMHGGVLESNHAAQRQALLRQKAAVDMVRKDRAASPALRELICEPSRADPPHRSGLPEEIVQLSADKHDVLERALGTTSVLAVEGPPGTGKTTLIAELIGIYLHRNPSHRVLLSSQTHIALDHVIAKLLEKGLGPNVLRIHNDRSTKVGADILPLTLERKTRAWLEQTEYSARTFLQQKAAEIGIERDHVEIVLLAQQRNALGRQRDADRSRLHQLNCEIARQNEAQSASADEESHQITVDETATALDEAAMLKESVEVLENRIRRLDEKISSLGEFGREFVSADQKTGEEWIELLNPPEGPETSRFVAKLQLQMDWFSRLGATKDFYPAVVGHSRVVAGTCVGLGGLLASTNQVFDLCIIDEASKATPTEALVPMVHSRRWVLVGDPRQLPPFVEEEAVAGIEGYTSEEVRTTLLDIFLEGLPSECRGRLKEQRRMAGAIGELVSEVFYKGDLVTVRSDSDRRKELRKLYPQSVMWFSTSGKDSREVEQPGRTFKNPRECTVIAGLLEEINAAFSHDVASDRVHVAIIASYSAQVRAIRLQLQSTAAGLNNISYEVNTVDAFQGRDADVCIYSVTRSNANRNLGFQREVRRLNVALSRGRDALLIVGDADFCRSVHTNNPFLDVLAFIESSSGAREISANE